MKKIMLFVAIVCATFSLNAQNNSEDEKAVKEVVQHSYVDGIKNYGTEAQIMKGFDQGFNLLYVRDGEVKKLAIADWAAGVQRRKANNPNLPETGKKASAKFKQVIITGNAATVCFDLYEGDTPKFNDHMFLYKIDGEWKIVSKISHRL